MSNEEETLRYNLAFGKLSYREFVKEMAKISQTHKEYLNDEEGTKAD